MAAPSISGVNWLIGKGNEFFAFASQKVQELKVLNPSYTLRPHPGPFAKREPAGARGCPREDTCASQRPMGQVLPQALVDTVSLKRYSSHLRWSPVVFPVF